jgi:cell division transport system ATP-binding protein
MITLANVSKTYPPDQVALKQLDLKVAEGDFVFIAGASGAGKSTLLRLLFAAERASTGSVVIGGRNIAAIDPDGVAALRREIGVVFQDFKLLPRRNLVDNVACTLEVRGVPLSARTEAAKRMLAAVGLGDRLYSYPLTLSGGEQQRVAIARALVAKPRMILADEPTGNLDAAMTAAIFDLLLEANAAGVTVICASHNLSIIEELNRRTVVLDRGTIIGDYERPRGLDS